MGEIAEAMTTGMLCCECGACYNNEDADFRDTGIPVRCNDCHKNIAHERRIPWKKAREIPFHGVHCEQFYL